MSSFHIAKLTDMGDRDTIEEHLAQRMEMEEDRFLSRFHQHVKKERETAWYN